MIAITRIATKQQKPARKEHIVPRLLLANFIDGNGVLWVYTKDKPVRRSNPQNECSERDFYEYELNGRKPDNQYEKWLGRAESDAHKVLQLLTGHERVGQQDAVIWSSFVASLFFRTRKVRTQISDAMVDRFKKQTEDPDFIRTMQYELLQQGEFHFAEELRGKVEKLRSDMDKSPSFYHVSGLPRNTAILADACDTGVTANLPSLFSLHKNLHH